MHPAAHSPAWSGVLFDLDGTLVDTIALIVASFDHALTSVVGAGRPEPQVRAWIGRRLGEVFASEYPEQAQELEATYVEWNRAQAPLLIRRYDGVEDLLRGLLDVHQRMGVVTSKRRGAAIQALQIAGLDGLIDIVAASEDTTAHKPEPAPLQHGAARLSVPIEQCVYVGDAVVDIEAARAAGMASIAVTWGAGDPEALAVAGADHLVESPAALYALLLGR